MEMVLLNMINYFHKIPKPPASYIESLNKCYSMFFLEWKTQRKLIVAPTTRSRKRVYMFSLIIMVMYKGFLMGL